MHSDQGSEMYKAPAASKENILAEERNVFNFTLAGDNYEDRARIVLNPDAKAEYEIGRDASKFFADNADDAQIYVAADANYSICERPVADGVASLGIRASQERAYTLSLSGRFSSEWKVMLTDNAAGVTVNLAEQDYDFVSFADDSASRFSVKFVLEATGIDAVADEFGKDAEVTVTGINGMVVFSGRLSEINVPVAGIYMISDGNTTRKAILK